MANADDFIKHANPILIQTSVERATTDDIKLEREVRNSIRLGDLTEDGIDIAEDRKRWCVLWCITVYNDVEGKYVQVWKIAEVHESSK